MSLKLCLNKNEEKVIEKNEEIDELEMQCGDGWVSKPAGGMDTHPSTLAGGK